MSLRRPSVEAELRETLARRIMFFDGGMGTMVQQLRLEEEDFRGACHFTPFTPFWNRSCRCDACGRSGTDAAVVMRAAVLKQKLLL